MTTAKWGSQADENPLIESYVSSASKRSSDLEQYNLSQYSPVSINPSLRDTTVNSLSEREQSKLEKALGDEWKSISKQVE